MNIDQFWMCINWSALFGDHQMGLQSPKITDILILKNIGFTNRRNCSRIRKCLPKVTKVLETLEQWRLNLWYPGWHPSSNFTPLSLIQFHQTAQKLNHLNHMRCEYLCQYWLRCQFISIINIELWPDYDLSPLFVLDAWVLWTADTISCVDSCKLLLL